LERATRRSRQKVVLTPEAVNAIRGKPWPGNVRELENAIERAVVLSADGVIRAEAFSTDRETTNNGVKESPSTGPGLPVRLSDAIAVAEREAIQRALDTAGGSRAEAAKALGISVRSLFYKIKELAL
jgi:two-component system response regulator AtoC